MQKQQILNLVDFFGNQIRKDINTHTYKEMWRSEETGTANEEPPHRSPTSHTFWAVTDHRRFWSSVSVSECHHQTQKYDSEDMFTITFLLLEANPDKMKCKEHCMSSSSKYRHEFASAGPKGYFLLYPLTSHRTWKAVYVVSRCKDCQNPRSIHHLLAEWPLANDLICGRNFFH